MQTTRLTIGAALLTLILCAQANFSQAAPLHRSPKNDLFLAQTLAQTSPRGWSSVIVQWNGARTPARLHRLRALGAQADRPLPLIHADALRLPSKNLARLAALPFVKHVSADLSCRKSDEYTVGATGADVAFAQDGLTGMGVTVAVLDSGIQSGRSDIQNRTVASVNFSGDAYTADDLCGHGTHVAGIIAGDGTASTGPAFFRTFYGLARQARLVNVRVLDKTGQGTASTVVQGIGWAVAHKSSYSIRVLNLSLGHPVGESYTTDPLCQAVEAAWKAGIVVVCAAGNGGRLQSSPAPAGGSAADNEGWGTAYGSIQSPANDPAVITVGAMKSMDGIRADDKIATYSSRGPSRLDFVMKPDLVAPGNRIISVNANGSYLATNYGAVDAVGLAEYSTLTTAPADTYLRLSGTSMASPVVAGAAALLLQADPTLSPDTIKARLMISADKWAAPAPVLADSSLEAVSVGAGKYQYDPSGSAWTFSGTAGIQSNGSAWQGPSAPDGVQTAFLQGYPAPSNTASLGALGSMSQRVNFPSAGAFRLMFKAAQRNGVAQPIQVSVDGAPVGGVISPTDSIFHTYATSPFAIATPGSHIISLAATDSSADKSSFVDSIVVVSVNDPCTYGAGYLNIPAALSCAYTPTQPALSPTLSLSPWGLVFINTQSLFAGGNGLWGTGLQNLESVWGSQVIWGEGEVGSSQVIWGEGGLGDSQVIWGENVWSDQVIWGEGGSQADLSSTALVGDPDVLHEGPLSLIAP